MAGGTGPQASLGLPRPPPAGQGPGDGVNPEGTHLLLLCAGKPSGEAAGSPELPVSLDWAPRPASGPPTPGTATLCSRPSPFFCIWKQCVVINPKMDVFSTLLLPLSSGWGAGGVKGGSAPGDQEARKASLPQTPCLDPRRRAGGARGGAELEEGLAWGPSTADWRLFLLLHASENLSDRTHVHATQ